MSKIRIELTRAQSEMLVNAAGYYEEVWANFPDGDLAGVSAQRIGALANASTALRTALGKSNTSKKESR